MEGKLFGLCRDVIAKYHITTEEMDDRTLQMAHQYHVSNTMVHFNDHVSQCSYIRTEVPINAAFLSDIVSSNEDLRALFDKQIYPNLGIISIGCGPGTDMLGVLKFVADSIKPESRPHLHFLLCDVENSWRTACDHFYELLARDLNRDHFKLDKQFHLWDFLQKGTTPSSSSSPHSMSLLKEPIQMPVNWGRVQLVIFSMFFSDILRLRSQQERNVVKENVRNFFLQAKEDTVFVVVDVDAEKIVEKIEQIFSTEGMGLLASGSKHYILSSKENKADLNNFTNLLNFYSDRCEPRLNGHFYYSVYKKLYREVAI